MFCLVYFYIQPCSLKILFGYLTNAQPISFFYLSTHSPMRISLHRASLARRKRSISVHLQSQARSGLLHRMGQAQKLILLTNHTLVASHGPGYAEGREPNAPLPDTQG